METNKHQKLKETQKQVPNENVRTQGDITEMDRAHCRFFSRSNGDYLLFVSPISAMLT